MKLSWTTLVLALGACTPEPPCLPFEGTLELPNEVQAPDGDVTVALFPVTFGADYFTAGAELMSTTADAGAWAFCLPDQLQDTAYASPDPGGSPSFQIGALMLGAYVDVDGDGAYSSPDTLVAGASELLVNARGEVPTAGGVWDGVAGWNLMEFVFTEPNADPDLAFTPIEQGRTAYVQQENLLPAGHDSLGGVIAPACGAETVVDVVHTAMFDATAPQPADLHLGSVVVDATQAGSAYSLSGPFTAPPPADHLLPDTAQNVGMSIATYVALAYTDTDADGAWTPSTDPLCGASHVDPTPTMVAYLEPTSLTSGVFLHGWGLRAGWVLLDVQGGADAPPTLTAWETGLAIEPPPPT